MMTSADRICQQTHHVFCSLSIFCVSFSIFLSLYPWNEGKGRVGKRR
jgi:hypothetical protein